jgi:hypothetical protein
MIPPLKLTFTLTRGKQHNGQTHFHGGYGNTENETGGKRFCAQRA